MNVSYIRARYVLQSIQRCDVTKDWYGADVIESGDGIQLGYINSFRCIDYLDG